MTKTFYKTTAVLFTLLVFRFPLAAAIKIGGLPENWVVAPGGSKNEEKSFSITNEGNEPVRITVKASNTQDWRLSNMARLNAFAIKWRKDGETGEGTSLSTTDITMFESIPAGSAGNFVLKYISPTYNSPSIIREQVAYTTFSAVSSYMGATWKNYTATLEQGGVVAMDAYGEFSEVYAGSQPNYLMYLEANGNPVSVPVLFSQTDMDSGESIESAMPILMIMDNIGDPHILYSLNIGGNGYSKSRLQYAWRYQNVWKTIDVATDYFSGNQNYIDNMMIAFALDSVKLPHIAYVAYSNSYSLNYASYDGTQWVNEDIMDSNYISPGMSLHLKMDALDRPHITYSDDQSGSGNTSLYYASKVDGEWLKTKVASNGGAISDLVLDAKNKPYIAAYSYDQYYTYLTKNVYTLDDSKNWTAYCPITDEIYNGFDSLTLDSNGYPRAVYWSGGSPTNVMRYAQWTGVDWLSSDIISGENIAGSPLPSGFDQNGKPIVSYRIGGAFGYSKLEFQ